MRKKITGFSLDEDVIEEVEKGGQINKDLAQLDRKFRNKSRNKKKKNKKGGNRPNQNNQRR